MHTHIHTIVHMLTHKYTYTHNTYTHTVAYSTIIFVVINQQIKFPELKILMRTCQNGTAYNMEMLILFFINKKINTMEHDQGFQTPTMSRPILTCRRIRVKTGVRDRRSINRKWFLLSLRSGCFLRDVMP